MKCDHVFEVIERVTEVDWKTELKHPRQCEKCKEASAYKKASGFKIGTKALETKGVSGYQDDSLTLGKIIDDGGIPYEFKDGLRDREAMLGRQKQFTKELKARGKRYGFDPFSAEG